MLGLPKNTEISKQLPKKGFFLKFGMDNKAQESFDRDISRMFVINEVSVKSTNISKGETMSSFFVVHVLLKRKEFSEKNIALISKFLPSKVLMVLESEGEAILAVYETKLLTSKWQPVEDISVSLHGLNFDEVWANVVRAVQGGEWDEELTIAENIGHQIEIENIQKEVAKLEKQIKNEKQPKKKFELVQKLKNLKEKLC